MVKLSIEKRLMFARRNRRSLKLGAFVKAQLNFGCYERVTFAKSTLLSN